MKEFKPSHLRNMATYKPIKKTVNVRLDADVIEWLQSAGKGYQTRMNPFYVKPCCTLSKDPFLFTFPSSPTA